MIMLSLSQVSKFILHEIIMAFRKVRKQRYRDHLQHRLTHACRPAFSAKRRLGAGASIIFSCTAIFRIPSLGRHRIILNIAPVHVVLPFTYSSSLVTCVFTGSGHAPLIV